MKVLGIDYGSKRVGVASGDAEFGIAFPRDVLENKGLAELIEKIGVICDEIEVEMIVVGLPLNMQEEQQENRVMNDVRYFVKELRESFKNIKVEVLDERLSTHEGNQLLNDAHRRSGKQKLGRDAYAAQIILQRFFDKVKD